MANGADLNWLAILFYMFYLTSTRGCLALTVYLSGMLEKLNFAGRILVPIIMSVSLLHSNSKIIDV